MATELTKTVNKHINNAVSKKSLRPKIAKSEYAHPKDIGKPNYWYQVNFEDGVYR